MLQGPRGALFAGRLLGGGVCRSVRTAHTAPQPRQRIAIGGAAAAIAAATAAATASLWLIHADADAVFPPTERTVALDAIHAWGANKSHVAAPGSSATSVTTPTQIPSLSGTFRDVQLAATHGAAVDAHGDIVQWGDGYAQGDPQRTLVGHDIARVQLTADKLYALARNGTIYTIPVRADAQTKHSGVFGSGVKATALVCHGGSERFTDIAAGAHHLLALSKNGRVWSVALDERANDYGQLGTSAVTFDAADGSHYEAQVPPKVARTEAVSPASSTTLRVVPALRDVSVAQIAAGSEHSVARTPEGRVVSWGRNHIGQLGVGPGVLAETVAVPTEVVFPASLVGRTASCSRIAAGGANSFFVVHGRGAPRSRNEDELRAPAPSERIDVLAAGGGAQGSFGNGQRPQGAGVPVRVKAVSGLYEYSEQANGLVPIGIHDIIVGDGQCAAVLDAPPIGKETHRDVYVWGANNTYQLGTGRKGHVAAPVLLTLGGDARETRDAPVMNRLQLIERRGSLLTSGEVQTIAAGGGAMAIYTRE